MQISTENDQISSCVDSAATNTPRLTDKRMDMYKENSVSFEKQNMSELTGKADLNLSTDFFLKRTVDFVENQKLGKYTLLKTLGKGSSAKVVKAVDMETNGIVAIKIVERTPKNLSDSRIFREILIGSLLDHPHIVKLYDFYFNDKFFFLIFENVEGKQLYDVVLKKGALSEEDARKYFRQMISAIDYLHRNSIVHRDLKIENILIDEFDNVKLIDFGLSNFYDTEEYLNTFCGSLYFAAPELLMGNRYVGPEVDVWSLGVVLYVMLVGRVPFDDESIHQLQNKIKSCKFVFHKGISKEAQELLTSMILASDARINLENVKKAYWTNFGYKELLNNFMLSRKTIVSLNPNIVDILDIVSFIHFENTKQEMEKYIKIAKKEGNNLEKAYWSRKPIVSLYYLMIEKFSEKDYTSKKIIFEKQKNFKVNEDTYPIILHNYVNLLIAKENNNIHNRFFSKYIFKKNQISHLKNEMVQEENCGHSNSTTSFDRCQNSSSNEKNFPEIRKSFVKGFFKGLKIKNTSQEDIKTKLLKIFLENNIIYEASEKSYYCSYVHDQQECYFKLTLYFNVILSEHYVVLNCLNKNSNSFKAVYEILKQKISE